MILKKYLSYYGDWFKTATVSEIKGLQIINFIISNRGHEKYAGLLKKSTGVKELSDHFEYFFSFNSIPILTIAWNYH